MTIKQQGGIFGRNPTFNDVEVDGTLTLEGGLSTNSAFTVTATTSTIESTSGAELYIGRDDTAVANNNLIGGLAFKGNDSSASPDPQYCGMKAYASGSGNNPVLEFYSGNGNYDARTPQLSINYLGNVTIANGNLIMGTSGNGIDFSATSGTGTSELFDDYEEGTFTPVVADAASGGNEATASASNGYYTKVGRVVTVTIDLQNIDTTGLTSGNNIFITGLPFSAGSLTGNINYTGSVNGGGTLSSAKSVIAVVYDNVSYIRLVEATSTAVTGWLDVSEINSGVTDFRFSVTYFA